MKGKPSGTVNNKKRIVFIATILLLHFRVVTIAATASDGVLFTQEEMDYMAEKPILYVTLDPDGFPIEFYNKKSGSYVGVIPDVLEKISMETGIQFQYVVAESKGDALRMAKNRQVDITTSTVIEEAMIAQTVLTPSSVLWRIPEGDGYRNLSLIFTNRMEQEAVSIINKALSTISKESLGDILMSNVEKYYEKSNDYYGKLGMYVAGSAFLFLTTIGVVVAKKRTKKLRQHFNEVDPLTGYPNIEKFKQDIAQVITTKNINAHCIVNLGIASISRIREIYGYKEGDLLLNHMAKILGGFMRNNEIFARIANDDFVLLLQFTSSMLLQDHLNYLIKEVSRKNEQEYEMMINMGVYCLQPIDLSLGIDVAIHKSMQARKSIKKDGKTPILFFDDNLHLSTIVDHEMEQGLASGIQNHEFIGYIQPQILLKNERLYGGEILVRWKHPKRGLLLPSEFIPVFRNSDLILDFDFYMFEKVCKFIAEKLMTEKLPLLISYNFSRTHFLSGNFYFKMKNMVDMYKIPPNYLGIELTEHDIVKDREAMIKTIKHLKKDGFQVLLDNFGVGYSSFADLSDLMIDYIKIDKYFIHDIESQKAQKVLQGIIALAHSIDIKVICQGVETPQQALFLEAAGCDIVQGYYYYQQMPWSEFEGIVGLRNN